MLMALNPIRAPRNILVALTMLASAAPLSAQAASLNSDVECVVSVAAAKTKLSTEAEKRGADLAMMYFIGRAHSQLSSEEMTRQASMVLDTAPAELVTISKRCSMEFMRSAISLSALNRALAVGNAAPRERELDLSTAEVNCQLLPDRSVRDCRVVSEKTPGSGAIAIRKLGPGYRAPAQLVDSAKEGRITLQVPLALVPAP